MGLGSIGPKKPNAARLPTVGFPLRMASGRRQAWQASARPESPANHKHLISLAIYASSGLRRTAHARILAKGVPRPYPGGRTYPAPPSDLLLISCVSLPQPITGHGASVLHVCPGNGYGDQNPMFKGCGANIFF